MMQMRQNRVARVMAFAIALAALPAAARAQVQQGTSVIDDLLQRAENSLNDLQYAQALGFAKQVVDLGDRVAPDKRDRALFVIAGANYPEGEPTAQHRDVALATLKQMVRTKFDLVIPSAIRWAGLDSVLAEAKATTFGLASKADSSQVLVGPSGRAQVTARSSRDARFTLTVRPARGGDPVAVDSASGTEATLHFAAMRNDRPSFSTGDYEIVLLATDPASGDTISARYTAHVTAPELTFSNVPVAVDSSKFISERTGRYGARGLVVAALVGGGIFAFSSVMHADTALKSSVGSDSKGAGIAAGAAAMIIGASFMDKGRQRPEAIAANQKLRDDFATSIRNAQAENANRIATYRTTISIQAVAR